MGRELVERTSYIRDDAGDVIETVTRRESPWTDDDRSKVLALIGEKTEVCPGCGRALDECFDPATARTWTVHTPTCEACRVLDAAKDNDAEQAKQTGKVERGRKYIVARTE